MVRIGIQFFGGNGSEGSPRMARIQKSDVKGKQEISVLDYGTTDYGTVSDTKVELMTEYISNQPVGTRWKRGANTFELTGTKKGSTQGKRWKNITVGNGGFDNSPSKVREKIIYDIREVHGKGARASVRHGKTKQTSKKKKK